MDNIENIPAINWFPGHMAKAGREIGESLKLTDCSVALVDARIPSSSYAPELDGLLKGKPCVIAMSKSDLADEAENVRWVKYFNDTGKHAILVDNVTGRGFDALRKTVSRILAPKNEADRRKGMRPRAPRLMVVGIPNVGKSTFINKLANRSGAKTADRPGVTRAQQWIKVKGGYDLLDTPGILPPRYEDKNATLRLAFIGSIKDEVFDGVEVAALLCGFLRGRYPNSLINRYKLDPVDTLSCDEILTEIAKARGFLMKGGEADIERAAAILLDEFRAGKLGRITLETVDAQC